MCSKYRTIKIWIVSICLVVLPLSAAEIVDPPAPDVPSFGFIYEGQTLSCSPVKLIRKKSRKNLVKYLCKGTATNSSIKKKRVREEERGRSETERLYQELETERDGGVSYMVEINHSDALSPRIAAAVARRQLENRPYGKVLTWLLPARFYVSIRPQIASAATEHQFKYRNGGTRGGFYYYYAFDSGLKLLTQYEANIRDGDGKSFIDFSDISNSSRRLSYLSVSYEDVTLIYGKYWSAYYDVAGFTDYFMTYGKQGTAAFSHGGDGSESGTGRVDHMAQLHLKKYGFEATLDYQFAHDGPEHFDTDYRYSAAVGLVYVGFEHLRLGAAAAYAKYDTVTEAMRAAGVDGEDRAFIAGFEYDQGIYGISADLSYSQNHISDDQGVYFDAIGAELYLHYDLDENIRFAGGGNWMIPRDDNYAGRYSIRKGIISLQYTFGDATFDDLVYLEIAFPKGHLSDGEARKTSIAIGFRYLFDLR